MPSLIATGQPGVDLPAQPMPRITVPRPVLAGLWAMLIITLVGGIQQQFTPRAFYDNFPGFGMQWVSADGPYNEHLLRDFGGANLALAVVILYAILRPSSGLVRTVAAAMLVAQVPHFIYHAAHLSLLPTLVERAAQTATLAVVVLIPLLVLIGARSVQVESGVPATHDIHGLALETGSNPRPLVSER